MLQNQLTLPQERIIIGEKEYRKLSILSPSRLSLRIEIRINDADCKNYDFLENKNIFFDTKQQRDEYYQELVRVNELHWIFDRFLKIESCDHKQNLFFWIEDIWEK